MDIGRTKIDWVIGVILDLTASQTNDLLYSADTARTNNIQTKSNNSNNEGAEDINNNSN